MFDAISRVPVREFLGVQAVGSIVLAHFAIVSIGDANGDLTFAYLWGAGLYGGGMLAAAMLVFGHTQFKWALAGTLISLSMIGRAADILLNFEEFVGRPGLAVAIWSVMGTATLTSWAVIGALAGTRSRVR